MPSQPAQLSESAWNVVVFGIIWSLRERVKGDSALLAIYAALYSLGRSFLSFGRMDNLYFADLSQAQLIVLAALVVTIPACIVVESTFPSSGQWINAGCRLACAVCRGTWRQSQK